MLIFFIYFFSSSHELLHMFELTSVSADQYVSLISFSLAIVCVISCIFCFFFFFFFFFQMDALLSLRIMYDLNVSLGFFPLKYDFHSR